ncbi:MAG: DUF5615 family PIN-like protein [Actinomycetota bacterium]|nr:DUF5615 family PIN-like protein [Actinomycetota bacterium]
MRFLIDANLSPRVALALTSAGHPALHVADVGLLAASDDEIFDRAANDSLVIITADSDFGMLLALRRTSTPSIIQLRHIAELTPGAQAELLIANVPAIEADLERGAIVSMSPKRLAVRDLPLR